MKSKQETLVKNRLYIVGVSGGPDSMFCLDSLRQKGYKVIVAHVNYKKRASSDKDEQIIRNYCRKYSLDMEVYAVKSIPAGNFQQQARQIRYDFFQQLAQKHQTKYIIVAHHFDDHLETYLFQKQRKSLVDYWGLPFRTKQGKYWILRPLLTFSKLQIIQYLTQKNISYALDSTNQLPIYQRNIIRQELSRFTSVEKTKLKKEIDHENQALKKIKSQVREAFKKLVVSPYWLRLPKEKEYSLEVYLRLLYFWINKITNGTLQQRKKKLLSEIYQQLFISQTEKLILELGNHWQIIKIRQWVIISLKNNNI